MEAAQGHAHEAAGRDLVALEAQATAEHWPDVAFLAAAGQAMYRMLWSEDPEDVRHRMELLVAHAQTLGAPSLLALALALRGVAAAGREDSAALLADVGRAVALVDDDLAPVLDRCTVLVVCAAAYNALSLWELVDELYDRETVLEPSCDPPVQAPAVAVNRVLVRLEWAAALLELGEREAAVGQLRRAAEAAGHAESTDDLPELWRLGVLASRDVLAFLLGALDGPAPEAWVDEQVVVAGRHHAALAAAGDVEFHPLLDALTALGLLRLGRTDAAVAAARVLVPAGSTSTGARSFPAWVRAEVLSAGEPEEAVAAHRDYGLLVARARWTARLGVLAAARSKIAGERLTVDHARLSRDVLLDPLTGLSNRRVFDAWLATVPPTARSTALLLIDMDFFKEINDEHGHAVGDEVLRRVGAVLSAHVRAGDLALRLGGDEFAVVLQDEPADAADPSAVLEAFQATAVTRAAAIREAVRLHEWHQVVAGLRVGVSIGVAAATVGPQLPATADLLYREADARLYVAKSERGSDDPLDEVLLPWPR
jgi:diguanylate cyclase (GGDEF)-like protein